jgi:hypothetical protein
LHLIYPFWLGVKTPEGKLEVDRDPFDLFLEHCLKENGQAGSTGREGGRDIAEEICPRCFDRVVPGFRHCPSCGALQVLPDGVESTFKPRTVVKRRLGITLVAIERGYEIGNRVFTRLHLKIRNLSNSRAHISLTYVDSVLIDATGRQFSPIELEELPDESGDPIFPTWFYIYPEAYRDGILLFRESPVPLQKAVICAMHQENEDELFTFELDMPPHMDM